METPAPKQRSPWFYVLLGCGGLAALMCLGFTIFFLFIGKQVSNMAEGVTDPKEREKNARKQLGGLPEGYTVVASLSVFGMMDMTFLTDAPPLADGGVDMGPHTFNYFRVFANENNKKTKDFFTGKETSAESLRQGGINLDVKDIAKRGQVTIDGRKVYYVVGRGTLNTGQSGAEGLLNSVMFDCPGDALYLGVWGQADPEPGKKIEELELGGTVADEAELAKFLKPINPCGK